MINLQHMAPWVPPFNQAIQGELTLKANDPPFITFSLATINKNGYPSNRTLVYRGWLFNDKSTNIITFATDKRMAKYEEITENDKFEAVFYFEKVKKQFRFRGNARIIDNHHAPIIDLLVAHPSVSDDEEDLDEEVIHQNYHSNINDSDSDSDSDLEIIPVQSPSNTSITSTWQKPSPQSVPIAASICSPTNLSNLASPDMSYSTLAELQYHPPTRADWDAEIKRQWTVLSKNLKKQMRKPTPLTPMSDENFKQIDKIRRGVDGKKEDDGFKNFAVVALFIDHVDFVEVDKDRRYIYNKDSYRQWNEQEVCP